MKQLVIFDLDGTLIDSAVDIGTAIVHAATTVCDLPSGQITLEQTRPLMGKSLQETFAALLPAEYHARTPALINAYRSHYFENCARTTTIYPGMLDVLLDLRGRGIKTAVATTKYQSTLDVIAPRLGLTPYFDLLQGVEGFPSKPDPAILFEVLRKLNLQPDQAIMVGDTDNDVLCAQRAGMEICAVGWGGWPVEDLTALGPNYLVKSATELQKVLLSTL